VFAGPAFPFTGQWPNYAQVTHVNAVAGLRGVLLADLQSGECFGQIIHLLCLCNAFVTSTMVDSIQSGEFHAMTPATQESFGM